MLTNGQDFFSKDDGNKLFSRLWSRNSSKHGEASFRVLYYGGATGNVPFLWESQPGTPKHTFNDNLLPPLTPPPHYQSSPRSTPLLHNKKKNPKNSKILKSIFPKNTSKKIKNASPLFSSSSSSSSLSSSYSVPSTPVQAEKKIYNNNARSGSTGGAYDDDEAGKHSPTSTLCFRPKSESQSRRIDNYYYPIKSVKKVVLCIFGHGKAH